MPVSPRPVLRFSSGAWIVIAILFVIALAGGIALLVPRNEPPSPSAVPTVLPNTHSDLPRDFEEAPTLYWVDALTVGKTVLSLGGKPVPSIPRGVTFTIVGWTVDLRARRLAGAVYAQVDDNAPVRVTYRLPRPDVARFFHEAAWKGAGFRGDISTAALNPGMHSLNLIVINSRRAAYYFMNTNVRFLVQR